MNRIQNIWQSKNYKAEGYWLGKKRPNLHTSRTKELARQRALGNTYSLGRKRPEEEKTAISQALKGRKKPLRSKEHCLALSKAKTGKKISSGGANHYNWKGGVTKLSRQIRQLLEYRQWRTAVFERDNYACIWGGKSHGSKLEADHIKPYFVILKSNKINSSEEALVCAELWDIKNGRTLCKECHKLTHTYGKTTRS